MPSQLNLEKAWPEVREQLKENNIELTDEDLEYTAGKEDELLERVSKKLHKSKEDVRALIESISTNKGKAS